MELLINDQLINIIASAMAVDQEIGRGARQNPVKLGKSHLSLI